MPRRKPTRSRARSRRRSSRPRYQQFFQDGWRVFLHLPMALQIAVAVAVLFTVWFIVNGVYQVVRKPTELFFPISGVLHKAPKQTWSTYESIFRRHATTTITAEFLAALAQIEGSGNPIVRTYWRWSFKADPFEVYRPASSAVGMYQITDGTFAQARRYCIHDHVVVEAGPWNDWDACWFNSLYMRVIPSHAVELTAAYLDHNVTTILRRQRIVRATLQQKQDLAALIHLCGAGAGQAYARRGLRLRNAQRCGDHDARGYIARVNAMKAVFGRLARQG